MTAATIKGQMGGFCALSSFLSPPFFSLRFWFVSDAETVERGSWGLSSLMDNTNGRRL